MNKKSDKAAKVCKPPQLPKKFLLKAIAHDQLADRERYQSLALSQTQLHGQLARQLAFMEAIFSHVNMSNTDFEGIELTDVRYEDCDFATASWYQAGFYRVECIGCRMTGFLAGEAHFQDTLFKDCKINLAQFRFATFKGVRFEHCDLSDADFLEADLSGAAFVRCNLPRVELTGTRLAGIDLRGCNTEDARVGPRELQGATIDPQQAIALVRSLGINVEVPPSGE